MATDNGTEAATETTKRSVHRSPNFPGMSLSDAIAKVRALYGHVKRYPTSTTVIMEHLGYGKNVSGAAGRGLSALRQYGLLEEVGDDLKVSDVAFHILTLSEQAPQRVEAIRKAAQKPQIFRDVLSAFPEGLPSDATLSDWLITRKKFNPTSVPAFIRSFKATISFAKLAPDEYNDGTPPPLAIAVGDYVQWESQGVVQFESKRVTNLDGGYVFVEGSLAGIPLDQVQKVDPPPPPLVPGQVPALLKPVAGVAREVSAFEEGEAILQFPSNLSAETVTDLEDWLKLVVKKLKRRYGATQSSESASEN